MLPTTLRATVLLDGVPARGLFVVVCMVSRRKNDFSLLFGPTGDDGALAISRDDLLREAGLERNLFPVDYGHPELDFAGAITVEPLNVEDATRALAAYETFKDVSNYPAGYSEQLQESLEVLARHAGKLLSVSVSVEGEQARIIEKAPC